jgi:lipoyl(octanoyl) transferase
VEERKIASIGVHVQRGVTTHGFAVNVGNDLEPFEWVIACGLPGVQMTSLRHELEHAATKASAEEGAFRELLVECFCEVFERVPTRVSTRDVHHAREADAAAEVLA